MDERELIQVNLQLPSDALDKLSALVEQFRRLTVAVNGLKTSAGMTEETAESGFFEPERFQALREKAEAAAKRRSAKELAEAASAQREVLTQLQDAESAGREITEEPASGWQSASLPAAEEIHQESVPQRGNDVQGTDKADIPAVRQEAESHVPDAPSAGGKPDSQLPEPAEETAWDGEASPPLPPAVQADASEGMETPLGAGVVVTTHAEPPASRWTGVTEELVTPGPAPLTAEAVSLAFQRDGRRYDNGFPLY